MAIHNPIEFLSPIEQSIPDTALSSAIDYEQLANILPVDIIQENFGIDWSSQLIVVTELHDKNNFWKGISLVEDHLLVSFHKDFVRDLLQSSLGQHVSRDVEFSCKDLTEIETELITKTLRQLIESINNSLPTIDLAGDISYVTLVWTIGKGKVLLKMPSTYLSTWQIADSVKVSAAEHLVLRLALDIGSTKIKVGQLNTLEVEDCLLLKDSDKNQLGIKGIASQISVLTENIRSIEIPEDLLHNELMNDKQNSLDLSDFEIEIKAEFRNIRMQLSDINALQRGQVLDLADLEDCPVYLTSQGKIIAEGNLLIINDKFGVAIKDILMQEDQQTKPVKAKPVAKQPKAPAQPAAKPAVQQPQQPQPQAQPAVEEPSLDASSGDDLSADFSL